MKKKRVFSNINDLNVKFGQMWSVPSPLKQFQMAEGVKNQLTMSKYGNNKLLIGLYLCSLCSITAVTGLSYLRPFSSWIGSTSPPSRLSGPLTSRAEGSEVLQRFPWQYQQIRTRKRGTEYQPKNIKRKRTHGWIKRVSSQGGIEVILRRMLKGRKSLTH